MIYTWKDGKQLEVKNKTLIMGILNVTPDSFSDGGIWNTKENAVLHTKDMIADGADVIDVGAESTRPGCEMLTAEEEIDRLKMFLPFVLPVSTVPVSVDTYHWKTADYMLNAGAHIVNDVWGFQYDRGEMAKVAASYDVPVILMHNQLTEEYSNDIIEDLKCFLQKSVNIALKAGVKEKNIILDPGIGFAKDVNQNLEILQRLDELTKEFPYPWLLGASRKRLVGAILNVPAKERDIGTGAIHLWGVLKGCSILRVHDVKTAAQLSKVWDILKNNERLG